MKSTRALWPLALIVIAAPRCASTPEDASVAIAGCYYFERDAAAESMRLPWGVRLTDDPLEGWPALAALEGVRIAVTLTDERTIADHPFGYWRPLPGDSVQIGYPGGGGITLRLGVTETHLLGTARAVGDATPPPAAAGERPAHAVVLIKALCPDG